VQAAGIFRAVRQRGQPLHRRQGQEAKRVDIGQNIVLDDERCIMCSRCIRFSKEMVHDDVLGFIDRGSHTTLAVHPGKRLDTILAQHGRYLPRRRAHEQGFPLPDARLVPQGNQEHLHRLRHGCNTIVGSREGTVYRQTPRENEEVNSLWMCDQGRLNIHYIHSKERLLEPVAKVGKGRLATPWSEIIPRFAAQLRELQPSQIAIVASGRLTNEEAFLLSEIRQLLGGKDVLCDIVPRIGEADGILRSADLNPNTKGVELFGLSARAIILRSFARASRPAASRRFMSCTSTCWAKPVGPRYTPKGPATCRPRDPCQPDFRSRRLRVAGVSFAESAAR